MNRRSTVLLLLPPALVLGLAGCSGSAGSEASTPAATVTVTAPGPAAPSTQGPAEPTTPPSSAAASVGLEEVASAALAAVGSGTVVSIDEEDDGDRGWDVHVVVDGGREQQVGVGTDGQVVSGPTEDDTDADDRRENERLVAAATAELSGVIAAAEQAGSGSVTDLVLEEDDGQIFWEADVEAEGGSDRTIVIDPGTGEVR